MAQQQEQKDGLALIVGGIFVLALVFAGYNYFNKGELTDSSDSKNRVERTDEDTNGMEGDLNGDGATSMKDGETKVLGTGGSTETNSMTYASTWEANNYEEGDIQGEKYTVAEGDTLWEIAEGAYGDGTQWTRIRDANSDEIEMLPNGQQALIFPGQVLMLP